MPQDATFSERGFAHFLLLIVFLVVSALFLYINLKPNSNTDSSKTEFIFSSPSENAGAVSVEAEHEQTEIEIYLPKYLEESSSCEDSVLVPVTRSFTSIKLDERVHDTTKEMDKSLEIWLNPGVTSEERVLGIKEFDLPSDFTVEQTFRVSGSYFAYFTSDLSNSGLSDCEISQIKESLQELGTSFFPDIFLFHLFPKNLQLPSYGTSLLGETYDLYETAPSDFYYVVNDGSLYSLEYKTGELRLVKEGMLETDPFYSRDNGNVVGYNDFIELTATVPRLKYCQAMISDPYGNSFAVKNPYNRDIFEKYSAQKFPLAEGLEFTPCFRSDTPISDVSTFVVDASTPFSVEGYFVEINLRGEPIKFLD